MPFQHIEADEIVADTYFMLNKHDDRLVKPETASDIPYVFFKTHQ